MKTFLLGLLLVSVLAVGCIEGPDESREAAPSPTGAEVQATPETIPTPEASPLPTLEVKATPIATASPSPQPTIVPDSKPIVWDYLDGKWVSSGTPPECPALVFSSPVDIGKATSILYPGQRRGEYKPHGGFRFDNQNTNAIDVRAPFDGYVWRGARYLEGGQVQYSIDIVNGCGIMHRFDHLLELSPEFKKLAEKLPEPKEADSRTTVLEPFLYVKKGDLIATKVGKGGNVGMDWGVYDLRKENAASKAASYRQEFQTLGWSAFHALCWLNYLPEQEKSVATSLPGGDGVSGKKSDYC
jgi:hypothetical protein